MVFFFLSLFCLSFFLSLSHILYCQNIKTTKKMVYILSLSLSLSHSLPLSLSPSLPLSLSPSLPLSLSLSLSLSPLSLSLSLSLSLMLSQTCMTFAYVCESRLELSCFKKDVKTL